MRLFYLFQDQFGAFKAAKILETKFSRIEETVGYSHRSPPWPAGDLRSYSKKKKKVFKTRKERKKVVGDFLQRRRTGFLARNGRWG